jgi:hypothetical protein
VKAIATPPIPVDVGEPRSYAGLTVVPLYADWEPRAEYISLDEAIAAGFQVEEADEAGVVGSILVTNPLGSDVLLYEGEEIAGAKQDRIFDRPVLVPERASVNVPVLCVESGRWSYRSRRFKSSPHAAYPSLRHATHTLGQEGVWADVRAKSARLGAVSKTTAAEAMYIESGRQLDDYVAALPCRDGQRGSIVYVAGKVACLDFVSRADVHARIYPKLLRGYALDAIDAPVGETDQSDVVQAFLSEVAETPRGAVETVGRGAARRLVSSRLVGWGATAS